MSIEFPQFSMPSFESAMARSPQFVQKFNLEQVKPYLPHVLKGGAALLVANKVIQGMSYGYHATMKFMDGDEQDYHTRAAVRSYENLTSNLKRDAVLVAGLVTADYLMWVGADSLRETGAAFGHSVTNYAKSYVGA